MAKRSLKASESGIAVAKRAFQRTGWTQEYLAGEVGLETRQSIWKFFSGRPVERHIFIEICFRLDLDWEDIAQPPEVDPLPVIKPTPSSPKEIDTWVTQLRSRYHSHIEACCNPLQSPVLLTQPRTVTETYVPAEVLSELTYQRWINLDELDTGLSPTQSLTLTETQRHSAIDAVTQHPCLVVTGKPGAGKTTFLKHLALQCNAGQFQPHCLPIFLSLQQSETQLIQGGNLLDAIITQLRLDSADKSQIEALFKAGRILLLLDGLDEVSPDMRGNICHRIQDCFQTFPTIKMIMSQRSAGLYPYLPGFQYVELAELSDNQITTFAQHWFKKSPPKQSQNATAKQFLQQIFRPEARSFLELSRSPLLLTFLCSIFQQQAAFPKQTSRIYRACWDLLLSGWDQTRGIVRGPAADKRITTRPSNAALFAILGQLATVALSQESYFLDRQTVLQTIAQYLIDTETVTDSFEQLFHQSETLLQSILADTGLLVEQAKDIYALPTIGFYTYLTARQADRLPSKPIRSLKALTEKLPQPVWHITPLTALGLSPAQWAFNP